MGREADPRRTPGPRPNCRLRSDGVAPAHLAVGPDDPVVGAAAIRHRDRLVVRPQHRPGDLRTPVAGDGEDGHHGGHRHPEPGLAPLLPPRGLVGVDHSGRVDGGGQLVIGGLQRLGRPSLQLGDHPGGDRQPEQVAGQLLDLPLAEAVGPGPGGQYGLQVGAEAAGRDAPGGVAQVVIPQRGQVRRCRRYSSTIGSIRGSSATCWIKGMGSSPCRASPQRRHASGLQSVDERSRSGGTRARVAWR